MVSPIVFPDTAAAVIDWLSDWMDVPIAEAVPNPRPDQFVTVLRTGGTQRNLVTDEAQVTVDTYGQTSAEAHDLAQDARGLIHELVGESPTGFPIYRVTELAGPANIPDPLSTQARYRQSFSVAARGAVRTGS